MNLSRESSINNRFKLIIVIILFYIITIIIFSYFAFANIELSKKNIEKAAIERAQQEVKYHAVVMEKDIAVLQRTLRWLATNFSEYKSWVPETRRFRMMEALRASLKSHPEAASFFTHWRKGYPDNLDKQFAYAPGHDSTGQFIPYWVREPGDKLAVYSLTGIDTSGIFKAFKKALSGKLDILMNPYLYPFGGKEIMMTTLVTAIPGENNEYPGIIGVDMPMTGIEKSLKKIKLFKSGYGYIFSSSGKIALHPKKNS